MNDKLEKAFEFLKHNDLEKLPLGRIDIDGDKVYAKIMEYDTIPFEELKFEAHKKYVDIHYITAGKEAIGCVDIDKLIKRDEYNIQKDVFFGRPDPYTDTTWIILSEGELAILYPSDAHAPKGMVGSPTLLKKIVIKVAI